MKNIFKKEEKEEEEEKKERKKKKPMSENMKRYDNHENKHKTTISIYNLIK
jgi:hypothetical protein